MRVLCHAIAVVVGAAVSIASVAVHRSMLFHVPLGLLLAVGTTFVTAWAMHEMQPRLVTSFAAGWLVAFGFALVGRSEGDYAIASDVRGYTLIAAALVMVAVGAWSVAPRRSSSVGRTT